MPLEGGGVDAAVTVTVVDCDAEPPAPVQLSEYVDVALRTPVLCVPEVDFVPDQAPEALHELALLALQLIVEAPPELMEAGFAEIVTLGARLWLEPDILFSWYTRITGKQSPI
jgi:hypothetical protein